MWASLYDPEAAAQHLQLADRPLDVVVLDLGRQFRLSYLPPLMVYLAAGISGLTAIVGTFFVKEHFGFSAAFGSTSLAFSRRPREQESLPWWWHQMQ